MDQTGILIGKIVAMFLVILLGWLARRRAMLDVPMTGMLSRFTTDFTLPALIFTQILNTVNRDEIPSAWPIPVMAAAVLLLGQIIALISRKLFACPGEQARTFIFVVMMANWIYLPLPIVEALWREEGVRAILLCNVGVQLVLWTSGIAALRGQALDPRNLLNLITNPGIIATVVGILIASLVPQVARYRAVIPLIEAIAMIGSLTIPLSLIATGAQLAGIKTGPTSSARPLAGVIVLRLIVVPLVALGGFRLLQHSPARLPHVAAMCGLLIAAMPVAISASILAERHKQDTDLAARSIFYTTLLSILTVPALFWLAGKVMG
jgi:malate permease and related proteins